MKVCLPVPSRLSTNCSSSAVPRVATHQRLGFAAGEQRRAMGARQDADFRHDGTHGGEVAAIDALLGVQHRVAHHIGFDIMHQAGIDAWPPPCLRLRRRIRRRTSSCTALSASRRSNLIGSWNALASSADAAAFSLARIGACTSSGTGARLLRRLFRQADDGVDGMLHLAVAEHHGAEHDVFAELLGFGFHHHHRVMGAGDDQFELGIGHVVDRRIELVFAVDVADAGGADRAHEGQAGNGQRGGHRDHRHDIGIIFQVVATAPAPPPGFRCDSLRRTADGWGGRSGARSASRARWARARA